MYPSNISHAEDETILRKTISTRKILIFDFPGLDNKIIPIPSFKPLSASSKVLNLSGIFNLLFIMSEQCFGSVGFNEETRHQHSDKLIVLNIQRDH